MREGTQCHLASSKATVVTRQQGRLGGPFKSPYRKSSSLRADDFGIFRKWSKGAASLLADCGGKGGRSSFGGHKQVQLGGRRAELVEEAFCLRIVETIFPCKLGNTVWAAADNFAGGCPIGVFYHVSNLLSVPHPIDSAKVELGKTLKVALPPLKAAFRRGSRNKKGKAICSAFPFFLFPIRAYAARYAVIA
jgi:hypothetical protein